MSSEKRICTECGREPESSSLSDAGICEKCVAAAGNRKAQSTASSPSHLLPPRKPGASALPTRSNPLLPPRRHAPISVVQKRDRDTGPDGQFVLLPDGSGGFERVSNRSVRITEGGTEVLLASRPRGDALRHRILVNMISIIVGLAILFGVFWLAINGWL